jgi:hypothetical protein
VAGRAATLGRGSGNNRDRHSLHGRGPHRLHGRPAAFSRAAHTGAGAKWLLFRWDDWGAFFPNGRSFMAHVNRLHDSELLRRGTSVLVAGSVWAAFAALALAATIYDVGKWLAIW